MLPIILVFALLLFFSPNLEVYDAIPEPIGNGTNWESEDIDEIRKWTIAPENQFTQSIGKEIEQTFKVIPLIGGYFANHLSLILITVNANQTYQKSVHCLHNPRKCIPNVSEYVCVQIGGHFRGYVGYECQLHSSNTL